jgi:hypothetical protein
MTTCEDNCIVLDVPNNGAPFYICQETKKKLKEFNPVWPQDPNNYTPIEKPVWCPKLKKEI